MRFSTFVCGVFATLVLALALSEAISLPRLHHPSFGHTSNKHIKKIVPVAPAPAPKKAKKSHHSVFPSSANYDLDLEESASDKMFDELKPLHEKKDVVDRLYEAAEKKENDKLEAKMALERLDNANKKANKHESMVNSAMKFEEDSEKLFQPAPVQTEPESVLKLEQQVKQLSDELSRMKHEIKEVEEAQFQMTRKQQDQQTHIKAAATTTHEAKHAAPKQASNGAEDQDEDRLPIIDDIADAATAKLKDWGLIEASKALEENSSTKPANNEGGLVSSIMETLGLEDNDDNAATKPQMKKKGTAQKTHDKKQLSAEEDDNGDEEDADEAVKESKHTNENENGDEENAGDEDNATTSADEDKSVATATLGEDADNEDEDKDEDKAPKVIVKEPIRPVANKQVAKKEVKDEAEDDIDE